MSNIDLITHLRHVGYAMPQLEEQLAFYRDTWGLVEVAELEGVHFLAAAGSAEPYVIRLRRDEKKRADVIAFGTATRGNVDALARRLTSDGVKIISSPRELRTPGGGYGVRFFDIDGRILEVSAGVTPRVSRDLAPGESIPMQLSHCVVNAPNPQATVDWYTRHLGLRLVETGHAGGRPLLWFLRCGHPQHHVLAIAAAPHVSMHHVSFDMRGVDEFLRGVARVRRAGTPPFWGPGRHGNGDNAFSYFSDHAGNTVEYTTGMMEIDDTWTLIDRDITDPEVMDVWGTANPYGEAIMVRHFNTPDEGLFVAPPI